MIEMRKCYFCYILILFCLLGINLYPDQSDYLKEISLRYIDSIVRIRAIVNFKENLGTGFFCDYDNTSNDLGESMYIITSYHIVANADKIMYKIEGRSESEAKIEKINKAADLALLKITNTKFKAKALKVTNYISPEEFEPIYEKELIVIGYPIGIASPIGRYINCLAITRSQLYNIFNKSIFDRIKKGYYFPSVYTQIQPLGVGLLPGDSGAPLFNENGEVVAIGNGGYIDHSYSINWAIPALYIEELFKSKEKKESIKIEKRLFWYGFGNEESDIKEYIDTKIRELKEKRNFTKVKESKVSLAVGYTAFQLRELLTKDWLLINDNVQLTPYRILLAVIIHFKKIGDLNIQTYYFLEGNNYLSIHTAILGLNFTPKWLKFKCDPVSLHFGFSIQPIFNVIYYNSDYAAQFTYEAGINPTIYFDFFNRNFKFFIENKVTTQIFGFDYITYKLTTGFYLDL